MRPQALVSGKKKIYIVSWYILFTIPETSACDCVKAFGHVLYKKYEKNTNNKKNTKILERNTKKNNESKGNNNKTRIFIHFWVVGGKKSFKDQPVFRHAIYINYNINN